MGWHVAFPRSDPTRARMWIALTRVSEVGAGHSRQVLGRSRACSFHINPCWICGISGVRASNAVRCSGVGLRVQELKRLCVRYERGRGVVWGALPEVFPRLREGRFLRTEWLFETHPRTFSAASWDSARLIGEVRSIRGLPRESTPSVRLHPCERDFLVVLVAC